MPEDILSYGRRDRRWCQGNFQHFWLIFGDRMKPWHRFYFAQGLYSYFVGPFIIVLALLRIMDAARMPSAPLTWKFDPVFVVSFLGMMGLPKVLGLVRLYGMRRKLASSSHGNGIWRAFREVASTFFELLMSMLTTPMLFYLHLRIVLEILTGEVVAWKSQKRGATQAISWAEAASVFWVPTLIGLVWFWVASRIAPQNLPYLMFLLTGWILSIPIAVATSSPGIGGWIARKGLLEECWTDEEAKELGVYDAPNGRPKTANIDIELAPGSTPEKI